MSWAEAGLSALEKASLTVEAEITPVLPSAPSPWLPTSFIRLQKSHGPDFDLGEGLIRGPSVRAMGVRVAESLSASVEVRLTRLRGRQATVIFEGTGRYAGLEVEGDLERLLEA